MPRARSSTRSLVVVHTLFALRTGNDVGYEEMLKEGHFTSYGGLPACADASYNLANPSHVDVGDAWRSYAVWVRSQPQKPVDGGSCSQMWV